MRARHRLRTLKMRVRWHEVALERDRLVDHRLLKCADRLVELGASVDSPETCRGSYLIVAAASRMELRGDSANLLVQQPIDHRVNVFVRRGRAGARLELFRDALQATFDLLAFFERQDTGLPEGHRPCLRETDVVRPKAKVDTDGPVES